MHTDKYRVDVAILCLRTGYVLRYTLEFDLFLIFINFKISNPLLIYRTNLYVNTVLLTNR